MATRKVPIEHRLQSRLLGLKNVRDALERLAGCGKTEVAEIQTRALDPTVDMSSRVDAITIILALKRGPRRLLRHLLNSEDRTVVIETLKAIKFLSPEWALLEIILGVRRFEDSSKRAVFAWALGGYPNEKGAEDALLNVMAKESESTVRDHAIESLGEFNSQRATETLLHALGVGTSSERFWAIYSLGNVGDARAAEALSQYANEQTTIQGLGTIGDEARKALEKIGHKNRGEAGEDSQ